MADMIYDELLGAEKDAVMVDPVDPTRRKKISSQIPHEDLLKPAWKGQVGIESRAYEWFTATISGMGKEKGLSFMRALN